MYRIDARHARLAAGARKLLLFLTLAAGIVLGGLTVMVLLLFTMATRIVGRFSPRAGADPKPCSATGVVVEGRYEVLEDAPGRQSHGQPPCV